MLASWAASAVMMAQVRDSAMHHHRDDDAVVGQNFVHLGGAIADGDHVSADGQPVGAHHADHALVADDATVLANVLHGVIHEEQQCHWLGRAAHHGALLAQGSLVEQFTRGGGEGGQHTHGQLATTEPVPGSSLTRTVASALAAAATATAPPRMSPAAPAPVK